MLINTNEGIDLAMGTETTIGINKNYYVSIPYPYSECRTESDIEDSTLYNALTSMNVKMFGKLKKMHQ
jgi:hypothetical protein